MTHLPGWRYYRNLLLLLLTAAACLFALANAYRSPLHWLWTLPLLYLGYITWGAFSFAHPRRLRYWLPVGPDLAGKTYEKVLLKARDGLTLFAWYLPGHNRAAVILAHGLGGSGLALELYAAPLVRAGYSVLLLDLRAHGSSDGDTSTYGVLESHDITGALDYLQSRPDLDPDRIGVIGISLGAQAALRAALQTADLRALVLEGLSPADIADRILPASPQQRANKPLMLYHRLQRLRLQLEESLFNFFSGQTPTPITAEIGKIAPRPILLIACGEHEILSNRRFRAAAGENCTLWELPQARHAAALPYEPRQYPRRVLAFLDHVLQPPAS